MTDKNVLSYYRIKNPEKAWSLVRWWDDGRKYELLKCIATLIYENAQDQAAEDINQAADEILADLLPSSTNVCNAHKTSNSPLKSSSSSGLSSSSIESGKIVNQLNQMTDRCFKWFAHLRNSTAVKYGKKAIFDSAVLLYRNWSIRDFDERIKSDQQTLENFKDEMKNIDGNCNVEVDDRLHQLLSGEGYVSVDRIPFEYLQKPAFVSNRESHTKFKMEVDSSKAIFDSSYTFKKRAKRKSTQATVLQPTTKQPKLDEVSSLSGLFD